MALRVIPRIERLHLSDLTLPENHPEAHRSRKAVVFGFAIDHPNGVIVVDTGVGRGNAFIDAMYPPSVDLKDALAAAGIESARRRRGRPGSLLHGFEWASVPADQLRTVRGDESIADGVRLLVTPGHTRGHQSVVVEARDEVVVIAAQAVWDISEFHDEEATGANVNAADLRDAAVVSIRRLKSLDPTLACFSHHPDVYRSP